MDYLLKQERISLLMIRE